jgi:hypothetical protein
MSTPAPEPTPADKLRASDTDRQKVVDRLQEAFSEGRLDLAELDERTAGAYAARTLGDLKQFTRDLPPPGTKAELPAAPASTPATAKPQSNDIVDRFKRGIEELPGWVLPVAGIVIVINLIGLVAGLVGHAGHQFGWLWMLLIVVWVAGGRSRHHHHNNNRDRDRNRRPPDRRRTDNDWYDRYHRRSRGYYDHRYRDNDDDD